MRGWLKLAIASRPWSPHRGPRRSGQHQREHRTTAGDLRRAAAGGRDPADTGRIRAGHGFNVFVYQQRYYSYYDGG